MFAWNNELAWNSATMNQNIVRNKNFIEMLNEQRGRGLLCLMGWWAKFID